MHCVQKRFTVGWLFCQATSKSRILNGAKPSVLIRRTVISFVLSLLSDTKLRWFQYRLLHRNHSNEYIFEFI